MRQHDEDESAYAALSTAVDDARWAFGTGFVDPLAGIDPSLPPGLEPAVLQATCLALADDALVMSHRLQQWVTRLPELEIEAAVANIALDLLGQGRLLLARAGQADADGRDEDSLAFFRDPAHWRSVRLVEPVIGDFAVLVLRLLVFSIWRRELLPLLAQELADPVFTAASGQAVKELDYHAEWAASWTMRLGDGTEDSHRRMQAALDELWPLLDGLFDEPDDPAHRPLRSAATAVREEVRQRLTATVQAATLQSTDESAEAPREAQRLEHDPGLAEVVNELQSLARQHPGAKW